MLVRWLIKTVQKPQPAPTHEVIKPPIIKPPPRRPSPPPVPPPVSPPPYSPPVVPWTEPRELIAWRAWRLGFFLRRAGGDGGPRLLSLAAPCIWNGPVVRDGVPLPNVDQRSEERRVGKEGRYRGAAYHYNKKHQRVLARSFVYD